MIDYKKTLNLPDTTRFSMRANLPVNEPMRLERWRKDDLYAIIREKKNGKKLFFLHDGPIYANGNIHLGHAVNRVLKDVILKFKGLMGYNAPYIPGWDCHGLPIELQVERLMNQLGRHINLKEFRKNCRDYVCKQIKIQKKDFIRLGVLGDWLNCYLTMDFKTQANTVRILNKIMSDGYLYRDFKPVYWCFQCRSVLSESEIEYNDHHISVAVDVAFTVVNSMCISKIFRLDIFKNVIEIVIWTTTPWTLPANQAVAINPNCSYQLVHIYDRYIVIGSNLVISFMKRIGCIKWKVLGETIGSSLANIKLYHPFMKYEIPIVFSDHVSNDTGTGLVHIAPNHGYEDYILAKKYNLKIKNIVNDEGFFLLDMQPLLNGLQVLQSNDVIVDLLRCSGSLLNVDFCYKHSYPYCARHLDPVIYRVTAQWFLNMDQNNLRSKLLRVIKKVHWVPKTGYNYIKKMIIDRPDWCISRQRCWGVPIPLFIHKDTEDLHPRTLELLEIIAQLMERRGAQAWWELDPKDLIGDDSSQYDKVLDTLDVWFDSGATHNTVFADRIEYLNINPDLYLEGLDQYRGWFMSSLVISVATRGIAPYSEVLSHGFTVDAKGFKMSKSVGNVISPQEIINNFGSDILRLWITSSDYAKDMTISSNVLKHITDTYRRIRNTARFCLVNLNDFDPLHDILLPKDMIELDRWIVNQALSVQSNVISYYNKYCFHNVVQCIMQFCSVDMGAFYLDVIKDRQYTTQCNSIARRSCQTALYHIIEAMVRWISPILSFTADEIWKCIPGNRTKYIFTEEWYNGLFDLDLTEVMNKIHWKKFFSIRNAVNKKIEQGRMNKLIKDSLEAYILIYCHSDISNFLGIIEHELSFGLIVSDVKVIEQCDFYIINKENKLGFTVVLEKSSGKKCARCWRYTADVGNNRTYKSICMRCVNNIIGSGENRIFF